MFTGIVQGLGRVVGLDRDDAVWTFRIQLPNVEGLTLGRVLLSTEPASRQRPSRVTKSLLTSFLKRSNEPTWVLLKKDMK